MEARQLREELKKTIKVQKSWEQEAVRFRRDWERERRGRVMLDEIYEKKGNNVLQAENNTFQNQAMCHKREVEAIRNGESCFCKQKITRSKMK